MPLGYLVITYGLPIPLGVICHVAVQKAVTSILVALLLSLIYY
jgi:hypothetical protein